MILVTSILLALFVVPDDWALPVVAVGAVLEVAETSFFWWWSTRRRSAVGAETLVGRVAEAVTPLHPGGQVRIDGELWQARCDGEAARGDPVRVVALDGLLLEVVREPASSTEPAGR